MGFPSQTGQVGFRTQSVKGTYVDPGAVSPNNGVFMRTTGGGLGINRELLIPDAEIGGNRDIPDAVLGAVGYSGEYSFYTRLESLAVLLKGGLGAVSSSAAGSGSALVGTHIITPANTLPWVSIEEAVSTFDVFRYTDSKVNTLNFEADANGYLKGSAGFVALTQLAGATKTAAPRWDTTPLLVGTNVVFKFNSVDLQGKSFKFMLNNNIENNDFRLGSLTLGNAVEKRREVMAEITIRPEDNALWRRAAYGSSAATAPLGGAAAKGPVQITVQSYEVIGTSVVVYSLDVLIPSAAIKPFEVKGQGDNVIETQLSIQALRPDNAVELCTVTLKDGVAAIN